MVLFNYAVTCQENITLVTNVLMTVSHWWNEAGRGKKLKHWEKNLSWYELCRMWRDFSNAAH